MTRKWVMMRRWVRNVVCLRACYFLPLSWDRAWSDWSHIELGQLSAWLIRQL